MAAYLVFVRQNMRDSAKIDIYRTMGQAAARDHAMELTVPFGPAEVLEGDPIVGSAIVRFENRDAAKAFYDSPAYQEATRHRLEGADYLTFIVEGI